MCTRRLIWNEKEDSSETASVGPGGIQAFVDLGKKSAARMAALASELGGAGRFDRWTLYINNTCTLYACKIIKELFRKASLKTHFVGAMS
jgi:hypothetical protein